MESMDAFDELRLTYHPSRHEEEWLMSSFDEWFDEGTLCDVLFSVRGGKEANVYACRGGPSVSGRLLAAKVYRPRKLRELRNDALYREGRGLLEAGGKGVRARDRRMASAVRKGTRKGKEVLHVSWVTHEFVTLQKLFSAGISVPEPLGSSSNAVLMAFIGDETGAAPTIERLTVPCTVAEQLFSKMIEDIEQMLSLGFVHGDLSPYNVMMWEDRLTIIDLPQACDVFNNPHAGPLFLRDVERMCAWFTRSGLAIDARQTADEIWDRVFRTDSGIPDRPMSAP